MSSFVEPTSSEGMLYKEYINWADDIEETLENANLPLNSTLHPPALQSRLSRIYNESFPSSRCLKHVKFQPSVFTISEESRVDLPASPIGFGDTEQIFCEAKKHLPALPVITRNAERSPCPNFGKAPKETSNDLVCVHDEPSTELISVKPNETPIALSQSVLEPKDTELSSTQRILKYSSACFNDPTHSNEPLTNDPAWKESPEATSAPLQSDPASFDAEQDSEVIWNESNDPTRELLRFRDPVTDEELFQSHCPSNVHFEARSAAQDAIDNIFSNREAWLEYDEEIHHFNWMGLGVHIYSATSPADSLAIILTNPKVPSGSATLRIQCVLNQASLYIDPVIVFLDDLEEDLFALRGSELVRALAGKVFKYYSPHGSWMDDPRDSSEETTPDFGNTHTYEATGVVIGNGFLDSSVIRSYWKWQKCRDQIHHDIEEHTGSSRKRGWKPKPSPLCQCETSPQPEKVRAGTPGIVQRPKRPRPKITTCVPGATPEEYFSFPTPLFGRRRALKTFCEKACRKLKSIFSSLKQK